MGDLGEAVEHLEGQVFVDEDGYGIYFSKEYVEIFRGDNIIAKIYYSAEEE